MPRQKPPPKTHCPHGHELVGDNVLVQGPRGHRRCRTCTSAYDTRRKREQRLAKGAVPGPPIGEHNGRAVLAEADVRLIRASADDAKLIARRFGITRNTVYVIRRRDSWKHVT